jgi:hypothetical protein
VKRAGRMLCIGCGRLGVPDTWVPGSERAELMAWCCLGFPGLVYCGWRHLLRSKHCAGCGGAELMREARASQQRAVVESPRSGRVLSAGPSPWPLPLCSPRQRLREGAALALFGLLALAAAFAAALGAPAAAGTSTVAPASALLVASGAFIQMALFHCPPIGQAWDETGQRIEIEMAGPDA